MGNEPEIDKATPRHDVIFVRREIDRDGMRERAIVASDGIGTPYIPEDIADERVREARREVWDAAIEIVSKTKFYLEGSAQIELVAAMTEARAAEGEE